MASKEYFVAYYQANKAYKLAIVAAWKAANPDKVKAIKKKSRDANRGTSCASVKRYKHSKSQRVPAWADLEKIKAIYQEAARTGMTVDHIIPLRGQLVSGLHVENNLQLLPGSVNYSKGNKFPIKD